MLLNILPYIKCSNNGKCKGPFDLLHNSVSGIRMKIPL